MSVKDQQAAKAKSKKGYVDRKGAPTPVAGRRPAFNPRPQFASTPSGRVAPVGGAPRLSPIAQRLLNSPTPTPDSGGGGFNPFGMVGSALKTGFDTVLNVADTTRRAYQGVAGEIGDVVEGTIPGNVPALEGLANLVLGNPAQLRGAQQDGQWDTSFDPGEIRRAVTGADAMGTGFLDRSPWTQNLPGPVKPVVGFAGDILTDPLTYVTAGTVKGAVGGAQTAGRLALAQNTAKAVDAAVDIGKPIATEIGEKLIKESGKRGLGAFTEKGLKRAGATVEDAIQLGVKPDFGYSVGVGRARVAIPGTRRLAESSENLKGAIKAMTGSSRSGRLAREMFTTAKYGERVMKQEILSGATDAATAARGLALVNMAKADSFEWVDDMMRYVERIETDGTKFSRLNEADRRALAIAVDEGNLSHPLVKEVQAFYKKAGDDLLGRFGVDFKLREGYLPHRLTDKAKRLMESGDDNPIWATLIDPTMKKEQTFQKIRQTDEPISAINAKWRAEGHDFDLLETDINTLTVTYLQEAQQAAMRGLLTGDRAVKAGVVAPMGQGLDEGKIAAAVKSMGEESANQIEKAVKTRATGIKKAADAVRVQRRDLSATIKASEDAVAKAERTVATAQAKIDTGTVRLASLEEAERSMALVASKARGLEKQKLTKQLATIRDDAAMIRRELTSAKQRLTKANFERGRLRDELKTVQAEWDTIQGTVKSLESERLGMEISPVGKTARTAQQEANRATDIAERQRRVVSQAKDDAAVAANAATFAKADSVQISDRLGAEIAEIDDWIQRATTQKLGRKGSDAQIGANMELSDRLTEVRNILKNSDDPTVQFIAAQEAQAAIADAAALKGWADADELVSLRDQFRKGVNVLGDARLQDMITEQTRAGWDTLALKNRDDMQINAWYNNAIQKMDRFTDPRTKGPAWRAAKRVIDGYAKALNWWKGWALASPGFVVRNIYSGMFNMYLDDVSVPVASKFYRFLKQAEKHGDDWAMDWARRKGYSELQVEHLMEARKVAAASGWGQTQQEFAQKLGGSTASLVNPVSANNAFVKTFRHFGQEGESFLRGGHAFAVLESGGTFADALERVQKFHFNYRDISEFDRNAKMVIPFWTFWSRNLGLQAQVFAKKPQKITRSFYNAKRNIEDSGLTDMGVPIPEYITGAMNGIATPFGDPTGRGQAFLTPDLPSVRYPNQIGQMGDNPINEVVQNLGPLFKTPVQMMTNRDAFTNREFKNSLTQYDSTGEVPRMAPSPFQLPGVRNVVNLLPGTELIDNQLLMQDNVESALNDLNPALSRLARAFPNDERGHETFRQWLAGYSGLPVRWNDPGSQQGAQAAIDREAQAKADAVMQRLKLQELVSNG